MRGRWDREMGRSPPNGDSHLTRASYQSEPAEHRMRRVVRNLGAVLHQIRQLVVSDAPRGAEGEPGLQSDFE
jgi:hypothetical protein